MIILSLGPPIVFCRWKWHSNVKRKDNHWNTECFVWNCMSLANSCNKCQEGLLFHQVFFWFRVHILAANQLHLLVQMKINLVGARFNFSLSFGLRKPSQNHFTPTLFLPRFFIDFAASTEWILESTKSQQLWYLVDSLLLIHCNKNLCRTKFPKIIRIHLSFRRNNVKNRNFSLLNWNFCNSTTSQCCFRALWTAWLSSIGHLMLPNDYRKLRKFSKTAKSLMKNRFLSETTFRFAKADVFQITTARPKLVPLLYVPKLKRCHFSLVSNHVIHPLGSCSGKNGEKNLNPDDKNPRIISFCWTVGEELFPEKRLEHFQSSGCSSSKPRRYDRWVYVFFSIVLGSYFINGRKIIWSAFSFSRNQNGRAHDKAKFHADFFVLLILSDVVAEFI